MERERLVHPGRCGRDARAGWVGELLVIEGEQVQRGGYFAVYATQC